MVKILYFGRLPDLLRRGSEELRLPPGVSDVRGLLAHLRRRGGVWERALAEEAVKVTVNRAFASPETPVADGDEVALVSVSLR